MKKSQIAGILFGVAMGVLFSVSLGYVQFRLFCLLFFIQKCFQIHIAFLIMIFTLKQGISLNGLQQLLPSTADEEETRTFYTSYVARLQEVGNFYTAQTRAAVQDILDPQSSDEGAIENVIIQSILQSGFSRIMAEKLLHLQDADPQQVLELEKISDGRGRHPLVQLPEKED